MTSAIITIGDEILLGQKLDTNSRWIAERLSETGVEVTRMLSVSDQESDIVNALQDSPEDVLLLTGGLGPTADDRTRDALCSYFNCNLVHNDQVAARIQEVFRGREIADLQRNKDQAMVPSKCTAIINSKGTAPGMWFSERGQIIASMPGVPQEMMAMMHEFVIPRLQRQAKRKLSHSYVMTAGIAESAIAERLSEFESRLPREVSLAYLPSLARVKLRLTGALPTERLTELAQEAASQIGKHAFAFGAEVSLAKHLGNLLASSAKTLATAESCTGGFIAHQITSVAGSSDYFKGAVIAYSNEVKVSQLHVKRETLKLDGAVSEEVVREMLAGLLINLKVDYGIAVSGIAGPGGGTEEKPVGTVWVAAGSEAHVHTKLLKLKGDRVRIIETSSVLALELLRLAIT